EVSSGGRPGVLAVSTVAFGQKNHGFTHKDHAYTNLGST
ncbi:uncharacterized protein METZ01_LOCUS180842, partial [marine metagenome]